MYECGALRNATHDFRSGSKVFARTRRRWQNSMGRCTRKTDDCFVHGQDEAHYAQERLRVQPSGQVARSHDAFFRHWQLIIGTDGTVVAVGAVGPQWCKTEARGGGRIERCVRRDHLHCQAQAQAQARRVAAGFVSVEEAFVNGTGFAGFAGFAGFESIRRIQATPKFACWCGIST